MIKEHLDEIHERMHLACDKAGRKHNDVKLIAVSKTKPLDMIQEAHKAGQLHFGENRMQELQDKMQNLESDEAIWHMIGTLQTNKLKFIAERVDWIHSPFKQKHLSEINKRAAEHNRVINILLQVNISEEDQKSGCKPSDVDALIDFARSCEYIKLCGFMGIAELVENPEDVRPQFKALKELLDNHQHKNGGNIELTELSMGMTNDLEVAIEEGSTMIRVGRAIFGERNYT